MTLNFLPTQSRQRYLIWIFLAVICIGAVVLWYGYFRQETVSFFQSTTVPPPREISLDFSVFENPAFQELGVPITEIPVPEPPIRINPFLPSE